MLAQLGAEQAALGIGSSRGGALIQRPSAANAAGSTVGRSSLSSAENGMLRASRTARVRARLTRMRKIQVRSDERPSKALSPRTTASHVSWTTSSAAVLVRTKVRATRAQRGVVTLDEGLEGVLVARP